jgi:hypothetical protein
MDEQLTSYERAVTDDADAHELLIERRTAIKQFGFKTAGAVALGMLATGAAGVVTSEPAEAQTLTDNDILNFALNTEYVEGEYYLRGFLGQGLAATDLTGTGVQGTVLGGVKVPFQTQAVFDVIQKTATDEVNHIRFLRRVLGSAAVAEPTIDLLNSFNSVGVAAGLVAPGTQFNPFLNEVNFLLGAFTLTDAGITAYAGAIGLLTQTVNISSSASILAAEALHDGAIRLLLGQFSQQTAANAISAVRAKLGGPYEQGVSIPNLPINIAPTDTDGLVFRRAPIQILSILYNGIRAGGGFLPNQANGTIK